MKIFRLNVYKKIGRIYYMLQLTQLIFNQNNMAKGIPSKSDKSKMKPKKNTGKKAKK